MTTGLFVSLFPYSGGYAENRSSKSGLIKGIRHSGMMNTMFTQGGRRRIAHRYDSLAGINGMELEERLDIGR
jgi:site-specific recombinase